MQDRGCGFDEELAHPILAALQALRQRYRPPDSVYWCYLEDRARNLRLPCSTPEDRALARLCLLARRAPDICLAWGELSWTDRGILTEGLMSPLPVALCGIPAYFAAVEKNPALSVRAALVLLSDVLARLRSQVPAQGAARSLEMNDLIRFASEVSIVATFEVGIETAKVEITSTRVVLTIMPRIWQRVKAGPDFDDRGPALARSLP